MKVGTKSLLFGVHQVFIHPLFVLAGWIKLYGWPNWKELVCIIIHDWGYWGCSDMDGEEGERHVEWAAEVAHRLFDNGWISGPGIKSYVAHYRFTSNYYWMYFCCCHSRFFASRCDRLPSKLCWADKLGFVLMPWWLWYGLGMLTGEYYEYINAMKHREVLGEGLTNPKEYFMAYRFKVMELIKDEKNKRLY